MTRFQNEHRFPAVALFLLLALLAWGCGGDDSGSESASGDDRSEDEGSGGDNDDYAEDLNELCAEFFPAIGEGTESLSVAFTDIDFTSQASVDEAVEVLEDGSEVLLDAADDFESSTDDLDLPDDAQQVIDDSVSVITDMGDALDEMAGALAAGDSIQQQEIADAFSNEYPERLHSIADDYRDLDADLIQCSG